MTYIFYWCFNDEELCVISLDLNVLTTGLLTNDKDKKQKHLMVVQHAL